MLCNKHLLQYSHSLCFACLYFYSAPSLSSITLRLRYLDDVGIGEIALVVRTKDCHVRRLDLSRDFGNSGVNIFAEALKTNTSLKTVSFGCYKNLNDVEGQVLLNVVDPFSQPTHASEWESVKRSNHTLQSVYILDRPTVTVNQNLITKLQSISTLDPHRTLQKKAWHHIETNIDDISHLGLESKHMPRVLSFVHEQGTIDHLFRLIRSCNTPEVITNPSPERARMSQQMENMKLENEMLKELLELKREKSEDLHTENNFLQSLCRKREEAKKCCLLPIFKFFELWRLFVEFLRESAAI